MKKYRLFLTVFILVLFCFGMAYGQLVVSDMNVTSGTVYEVVYDQLGNGELVYVDRTYIFSSVPGFISGATYIKTSNDDKNSISLDFLSFTVNVGVVVYVSHDDRISIKPEWLSGFVLIQNDVVTNDTVFSLYRKNFLAGRVVLGGNKFEDTDLGNSMYQVMIVPTSEGVEPEPLPDSPLVFRFVDDIPPSSIYLRLIFTWGVSEGAESYAIYMSEVSGEYSFGQGKALGVCTHDWFIQNGEFMTPEIQMELGKYYYFVATARNKYGESDPSNEVHWIGGQ